MPHIIKVEYDADSSEYFLDLSDVLKGTGIRKSRVKSYTLEPTMDCETENVGFLLQLFDAKGKIINLGKKELK